MLSSEPPSQYCIDKNHARRSWLLPGMKRRIFGMRRSIDIWRSPDVAEVPFFGFNFLSSAISGDAGLDISRSPILVSLVTWLSAIRQTIASTRARAAVRSGRMAFTCSSMNSMLAMIISALATAVLVAASDDGFSAHSAAAWMDTVMPGNAFDRAGAIRAAGPAEC